MYVNDQILGQGGPEFRAATVPLAEPFQGQEWEYIPDGNPDFSSEGFINQVASPNRVSPSDNHGHDHRHRAIDMYATK
ncbi:hypothetical protein N7499_011131 [Penicillium canescens]|uniref:Uncharacterized protein n=1 Tax=Penicillium canescens TaxID=5083 RepID=A0AAD6IJK2_PENCN|nr:uncharacterized protein N7446_006387 [Penicillium canescens]KAJ5990582.1 hypothetical protein N7522_010789 [Penicillium canescens]KAJ6051752.1 hypothetical protein N7460_002286 [Penicillium canescens]KAJ6062267.1 hypothetical protein N7446_006387 [Penicillium canescens]KAJ6065514.1 hypothetical protein N7444_001167 [Penicillium canescens]KAJ6069244.1 hypothetical protein N7499_011131 [Penicillium canescens]